MLGKRKHHERDLRALQREAEKLKTIQHKNETDIARLQAEIDATQRNNAEMSKTIAGIQRLENERKKILDEIEKTASTNPEIQSMWNKMKQDPANDCVSAQKIIIPQRDFKMRYVKPHAFACVNKDPMMFRRF